MNISPYTRAAARDILRKRDAERDRTRYLTRHGGTFEEYIKKVHPRYQVYRHCKVLIDALQKVADGELHRLMVFMPPRQGKLISNNTLVLTTDGWKLHGELEVGNYVFGPDGIPTMVVAVSKPDVADMEVEFTTGDVIKCHHNHEWRVHDRSDSTEKVISTKWMTQSNRGRRKLFGGGRAVLQVENTPPLETPPAELPLHPYVLGVWLGDGTSSAPNVTMSADDLLVVLGEFDRLGYCYTSLWTHKDTGVPTARIPKLFDDMAGLGTRNSKHIPARYLLSSVEQRLELLAGLIDTDGNVCKRTGRVRITTCSVALRNGIVDLLNTLGQRPYVETVQPCTSSSGIVGKQVVYTVGFQPTIPIPTRLPRKSITRLVKQRRRGIRDVRPAAVAEAGKCIQVDRPDGMYLVGTGLIPTHNSELVSRLFPGYYVLRYPDRWAGLCSYAAELAFTLSRNAQGFYTKGGGTLKKGAGATHHWETGAGGGMWAAGVGGPITGKGAHVAIIDDPVKNSEDAASEVMRNSQREWYSSTFYTRLEAAQGAIVIVLTRWNEADLAGWLLEQEQESDEHERWHIINFPAIAEESPEFPESCTVEPDWREPGEALCPERYGLERLKIIRGRIGEYWFASLYQQRPSPKDGLIFQPDMIKVVDEPPAEIVAQVRAWDQAATEGAGDFTAGTRMCVDKDGNIGILDLVLGQWEGSKRDKKIRATAEADGIEVTQRGAEDPGSAGKDAARLFVKLLAGFKVKIRRVTGDKETRAGPFASQLNGGNVWMLKRPWNKKLRDQLQAFPNGAHDDIVDTLSDGYAELMLGRGRAFAQKGDPVSLPHSSVSEAERVELVDAPFDANGFIIPTPKEQRRGAVMLTV